jgi:glutaredoxin
MVKKFLTMKGRDFEVINLDEQPERQAEALELAGVFSVPITTDGKSVVVGWNPVRLAGLL